MGTELPKAVSSPSDEVRESREARESGPCVGLFYVVNGRLHWDGIPVEHADGTPYFKSHPKSFSTYWNDNLVKRFPQLRKFDPDYFPRGRVVYDVQKDAYDLMADRCILDDPALIKQIVSAMKLPEAKLTTSWDINCECPVCKSTRIQKKCATEPDVVEVQLKTLKDGRKAYFPWGRTGYVIPSGGQLRSLKGQLRWEDAITNAIAGGIVAALLFESMSEWSVTPTIYAAIIMILYVAAFRIWVHFRFRGWEKTNERTEDPRNITIRDASNAGPGTRDTSNTGLRIACAAALAAFLLILAMWELTKPPRSRTARVALVSTPYSGEMLPAAACNAISNFTKDVDAAVSLLFRDQMDLAVEGALAGLEDSLKAFDDHPNIDEVRRTAIEYARVKRRANMLEGSGRIMSDEFDRTEDKIADCRAALKAMCGR